MASRQNADFRDQKEIGLMVRPAGEGESGLSGARRQFRWQAVEFDTVLAEKIACQVNLPYAVAALLVGRGVCESSDVEQFLNPRLSNLSDPFLMPGMLDAVERIWNAVRRGEMIVVYGDYDADGVTSTALLVSVLAEMKARVVSFLPNRFNDGYGFSINALRRCLDVHKPDLIITVDCGTCSVEAVDFARKAGIDVVITDHHELTGLPAPAVAVVNPRLGGSGMCTVNLAGVGVAFKLCHGLIKYVFRGGAEGLSGRDADAAGDGSELIAGIDLRKWLGLVAIGTVADVADITGENRILVFHGLNRINMAYGGELGWNYSETGLLALSKAAGIMSLDCYGIGFVIGPRLNAAGRLGHPDLALEILLANDPDRAGEIALELERMNDGRKRIEEKIMKEALSEIESLIDDGLSGLITFGQGWHIGIIGIVASRLCSRFRRPVVVISFDEDGVGRGSCRSIPDVDIMEVLRQCSDLLVSSGGHMMAAGLVIKKGLIDSFRKRFNEICAGMLVGKDLEVRRCDAWLNHLGEIDERFIQAVNSLKPFGVGNPTPVWGLRNVRLTGQPRKVGRNHIKMKVINGADQMEAIAFDMADQALPEGKMDLLFQVQENTYKGRTSLQLNVKDFRASMG